ncbi:MAG: hypothetical protein WB443_00350 [Nitrososphaeraceae archaeon]
MDPISKVATAIGSSLTIVLLFSKTVLSVKWWKRCIYNTNLETGKIQADQMIVNSESQSIVQVKLSKWNNDNLINKKVITCEMMDIGYISTLEHQLMTIIGNGGRQQKYVIPTYYIREYDDRRVLIDTSARYLDRYQIKETK